MFNYLNCIKLINNFLFIKQIFVIIRECRRRRCGGGGVYCCCRHRRRLWWFRQIGHCSCRWTDQVMKINNIHCANCEFPHAETAAAAAAAPSSLIIVNNHTNNSVVAFRHLSTPQKCQYFHRKEIRRKNVLRGAATI